MSEGDLNCIIPLLFQLHGILRWIHPILWRQISHDDDMGLPVGFLVDTVLSLSDEFSGISCSLLSSIIKLSGDMECARCVFQRLTDYLTQSLERMCERPLGDGDEIWRLVAMISSYPVDEFCDWFRPFLMSLLDTLCSGLAPTTVSPDFILIIINVCAHDMTSRVFLLESATPNYLSAHLINSEESALSQFSLLLLYRCLVFAPELEVDFGPEQLFRSLNESPTYGDVAVKVACIILEHNSIIRNRYLRERALVGLRTLLDHSAFFVKRLALRFLYRFMQICSMIEDFLPGVFFGFLPSLFLLDQIPLSDEEVATQLDEISTVANEMLIDDDDPLANPDAMPWTIDEPPMTLDAMRMFENPDEVPRTIDATPLNVDEIVIDGEGIDPLPYAAMRFLRIWSDKCGMTWDDVIVLVPCETDDEFLDLQSFWYGPDHP